MIVEGMPTGVIVGVAPNSGVLVGGLLNAAIVGGLPDGGSAGGS